MQITETTIGIWFSQTPDGDWLATVNAIEPEGFELVYRFRHIVDDKVFDSEDTKSWYTHRIPATETADTIIKLMREMVDFMGRWTEEPEQYEVLMGDDDLDGFMARFMNLPCSNAKVMTKEEAEEAGYIEASH